jgi:3-hydroxyisobutyryl-CoA hydrolase
MLKSQRIISMRYLSSSYTQSSSSSSSNNNELIFKKVNNVASITLNRPEHKNVFNLSMMQSFHKILEECELDNNIRAILVKGAGDDTFCAGGDIKSVRDLIFNNNNNKKEALNVMSTGYKLSYLIYNLKKPYISFWNGIVMGGGMGISIHGKYRIATNKTIFAMPEAAIGFFADAGGSYYMSRLKYNIGLYLILTGNKLKDKHLKLFNLATHYTNNYLNLSKIENELFNTNNLTNKLIDLIINKYSLNSNNSMMINDDDDKLFMNNLNKINEIFSNDYSIEKILELLENDKTEWSNKQLKLINKMSPISLKVTIKQLNLGKTMNLRDCLKMDYNLCAHFFNSHDFNEGVNALLIEKNKKPKWKPANIKEIDNETINSYFKPFDNDSLDI